MQWYVKDVIKTKNFITQCTELELMTLKNFHGEFKTRTPFTEWTESDRTPDSPVEEVGRKEVGEGLGPTKGVGVDSVKGSDVLLLSQGRSFVTWPGVSRTVSAVRGRFLRTRSKTSRSLDDFHKTRRPLCPVSCWVDDRSGTGWVGGFYVTRERDMVRDTL